MLTNIFFSFLSRIIKPTKQHIMIYKMNGKNNSNNQPNQIFYYFRHCNFDVYKMLAVKISPMHIKLHSSF